MNTKLNIITISGELASGKGTVTELLSKELNYEIYRNGAYFRKLAKENGMDVTSFNVYVNAFAFEFSLPEGWVVVPLKSRLCKAPFLS